MEGGWGRWRPRVESNPVRVTAGAAAAVSRRPAHLLRQANRNLSSGWRHGGGSLRVAGCHLVVGDGVLSSAPLHHRSGERPAPPGFLRACRRRRGRQLPPKPGRSEVAGTARKRKAAGRREQPAEGSREAGGRG